MQRSSTPHDEIRSSHARSRSSLDVVEPAALEKPIPSGPRQRARRDEPRAVARGHETGAATDVPGRSGYSSVMSRKPSLGYADSSIAASELELRPMCA